MKEAVTIKEIARQLRVSPSTVSRALQNNPRIGLRTRELVHDLAKKLHYYPNSIARNFREGRTGIIGVVLPEIREHFFSVAVNGIEEIAFEQGYTVALFQSHDRYDRESTLLKTLCEHRVDGVILSVAKETYNFNHIRELIQRHIPIVLFDRVPPAINTHHVRCNIKTGAYEATKLLISRGFNRIALMNGPYTLAASGERYEGYVEALLEAGLPLEAAGRKDGEAG